MPRTTRAHALLVVTLALVVASCDGNASETTTTSVPAAPTSTVPQVTTTTIEATTTTTRPPSPVLATEGDENEIVAAIQFLLGCTGYGDLTVDGNFGPATTDAVQAAQTALGFEPDGEPTQDLFALLTDACTQDRPIDVGDDSVTVVGHTATGAPEEFTTPLMFGSTLIVTVVSGDGVSVAVSDAEGTPVESADGTTFIVTESGDHTIQVSTAGDATMFTLAVEVTSIAEAGQWIITTDGIAHGATKFTLGTAAGPMIDKIFELLGHGVRSDYGEFDTGWEAAGQEGFRGIFIEGIAFLFYGPNEDNPGRPETFGRVRYVGPSFDADGEPRPAGYVQTLSGITVGNTLADLQDTYGGLVKPGSNAAEHYFRYGAADGTEVCFYFGDDEPAASSPIIEISTECRS
jgi:peptidoglycan hydrolase-like protein with peptidoglycan-binding domain